MNFTGPLGEIGHVIQLAIAPVFLLTAVATIINVLVGRLGRSVDRRRALAAALPKLDGDVASLARLEVEFEVRRIRLIYWAITSAVLSALLVALLISIAFIDAFIVWDLRKVIGACFVGAMFALVASLGIFLREIFLSVNSPRAPVL
ncbi:MAG TPA: DUF2721 domain-containing protein [Burkholderiales bacterium]|nr:DUF2721 domain-containing protein [Burkholderiales bacterium]HXJ09768.1 DUF2721 domain-containing protein [Burkholderiales bacterium]